MKFSLKHQRGETIAETIIALSIIAIGVTFSSTLVASSLRNMTTSKNRVLAVNIAREGIEAVRSMRDTNWLLFSGNRRKCWNNLPTGLTPQTCDGTTPIPPGDYIVYKDQNQRWRLTATANTQLSTVDVDKNTDSNADGDRTNDADFYNSVVPGDAWADKDSLGNILAKPTPFSREITIAYLDNQGNAITTAGALTADHNRMEVTSRVSWPYPQPLYKVELKTHLTDYLGRENLSQ